MEDEEEIIEDSLSFKWGDFDGTTEGPLDVLLMLIKKSKVEIEEVELSSITEQFLEYINEMEKLDMDIASSFVEEAAILIEIKSKKLLPKLIDEQDDEEDLEYLYKQRLQEYKLFKETTEKLKVIESNDKFYKGPEPDASKFRIVIKDMQLDMLLDAFANIMHRVNRELISKESKEIKKELFTVSQKISVIKDSLIIRKKIKFNELFTDISTKDEVITTFLALLELLKLQYIKVCQDNNFEEIDIVKVEEEISTSDEINTDKGEKING